MDDVTSSNLPSAKSVDTGEVDKLKSKYDDLFEQRQKATTQSEKVRLSEEMAEAKADVLYQEKGWKRLDVDGVPPGKQGKFDRIYQGPDGQIHVVECKGSVGTPHFGNRTMADGKIAQQGSPEYADDIIERLIDDLPKIEGSNAADAKKLAQTLEDAKDDLNIKYTLVNQRVNGTCNFKIFQ